MSKISKKNVRNRSILGQIQAGSGSGAKLSGSATLLGQWSYLVNELLILQRVCHGFAMYEIQVPDITITNGLIIYYKL